jgi:hypothetical protein
MTDVIGLPLLSEIDLTKGDALQPLRVRDIVVPRDRKTLLSPVLQTAEGGCDDIGAEVEGVEEVIGIPHTRS